MIKAEIIYHQLSSTAKMLKEVCKQKYTVPRGTDLHLKMQTASKTVDTW